MACCIFACLIVMFALVRLWCLIAVVVVLFVLLFSLVGNIFIFLKYTNILIIWHIGRGGGRNPACSSLVWTRSEQDLVSALVM